MKLYGNFILMTLICIVIFWIFMALRPAQAEDKWETNTHRCLMEKFIHEGNDPLRPADFVWVITPKDIPEVERELKALKACDAFYQCVAERDGYIQSKGKGRNTATRAIGDGGGMEPHNETALPGHLPCVHSAAARAGDGTQSHAAAAGVRSSLYWRTVDY